MKTDTVRKTRVEKYNFPVSQSCDLPFPTEGKIYKPNGRRFK